MDMILWRHAEAENTVPDEARVLTTKGRRHARAVAKWLREHVKGRVRVIASTALRAQQTAQAQRLERHDQCVGGWRSLEQP